MAVNPDTYKGLRFELNAFALAEIPKKNGPLWTISARRKGALQEDQH